MIYRLIKEAKNKVIFECENIRKKILLALSPAANPMAVKGKVYLYHGNLFRHEIQYSIPSFYGVALKRDNPRDIAITSDGKLPLPEGIADAFQSQDVLEHLDPSLVVPTLNEIYRVLKPGGFFRLSVPDYRSPLLRRRTIFNDKGEALGDVGMGATAFTADLNSELQIKHSAPIGDNHLWLPTSEKVKQYLQESNFSHCKIEFLHYIEEDGSFLTKEIPKMEVFRVKRAPPQDMRSAGMPISIIVDIIKA
ncbi:MAG: methyltransferase domain-containing protein [Cyanobacteriota bacterium]